MLVLVRHGEATANAAGLLLGRTDAPLTETGRAQAAAVGLRLGPVARLISSPLRRASDTAAALGTGLSAEIDDRWVEVDYGVFEGQPVGDLPTEIWRYWREDPGYRPEGGESLAAVSARVAEACDELFATDHDGARASSETGDVVVVSHVSPIKAAVAWALGVGSGLDWRLRLSTGSITVIGWGVAGPLLHSFNQLP